MNSLCDRATIPCYGGLERVKLPFQIFNFVETKFKIRKKIGVGILYVVLFRHEPALIRRGEACMYNIVNVNASNIFDSMQY
jgi:hypothetical protein